MKSLQNFCSFFGRFEDTKFLSEFNWPLQFIHYSCMYHHQFYNSYMEERSNKKVVSSFYFIHIMQYDTIFMIFAIIWTSPVICFPALHGSKKLSFQIELKVWACIIHEITFVRGGPSIIHIMRAYFRTYFNLPVHCCVDHLGLLRVYGSTEKYATFFCSVQ